MRTFFSSMDCITALFLHSFPLSSHSSIRNGVLRWGCRFPLRFERRTEGKSGRDRTFDWNVSTLWTEGGVAFPSGEGVWLQVHFQPVSLPRTQLHSFPQLHLASHRSTRVEKKLLEGSTLGFFAKREAQSAAKGDTRASLAMADARDGTRFSDGMREMAKEHWERAVGHRFVHEMGQGNLDPDVFRRYLMQDYLFVNAFASLLGSAVAKAPTMESKAPLAKFLADVTSQENSYFLRSFQALGVTNEQWENEMPSQATLGFQRLIQEATSDACHYGEALATLLAAEWSYLTWATALGPERPQAFYFAEWIDLHAIPEFQSFVGWLRDETDRVGRDADRELQENMARRFCSMMELEVAFFDDAYSAKQRK